MLTSLSINDLHFFHGAREGVVGPTATCELLIKGELADWPAVEIRLRQRAAAFWPGDPVPGLTAAGWPDSFVAASESGLSAWVVALTVACQRLAREPVDRGRVISAGVSQARLALPYEHPAVLCEALTWALRWLLAWARSGGPADTPKLTEDFAQWLHRVHQDAFAPNTLRFALAARQRGIPVAMIGERIIQLGWGAAAVRMESSLTNQVGAVAVRIARQKYLTSRLLAVGGLPVPPSNLLRTFEEAKQYAAKLGWPVVVKPADQEQGIGVTPGIRDDAMLRKAFEAAAKHSPNSVLVEKHVVGDDHRLLVVHGKLVMSARRLPGGVTGDGLRSVAQLMDAVNADPRRGNRKRALMIKLQLDDEAQILLGEQGLSADAVPEKGRLVRLRRTANVSTGGSAEDVTGQVHPDNRVMAERAAKLLGLDIAGIDFITPDITRSWREIGCGICEVNAQPGFRPHWLSVPERDINGEIVDAMFAGRSPRIPVAAITGTNGKSTTARMLHRIWMTAGRTAAVCTTNGVWIGDDLASDKNLSGQPGGRMILLDPSVEAAVLEMPRKGLLIFGHPCDRYAVAALLNVQDDLLGVDGIDSPEAMARLKAEVLERATDAVVVNAGDPLCLAMLVHAGTPRHILVALRKTAPALRPHLAGGGEAVFIEGRGAARRIVLAQGAARTAVMRLAEIPATLGGRLRFNESNALFAVALAHAQGLALAAIRAGLAAFENSPQSNPGRYNFIDAGHCQVLLDYAHNPDGVRELCEVVRNWPVAGRRHLVNLKRGNRHRAHIDACAPMLVKTFDSFIVGPDEHYIKGCADYTGADPVGRMLDCFAAALAKAGAAPAAIRCERHPVRALRLGLKSAQPGDLLVMLAEPWVALPLLQQQSGTGQKSTLPTAAAPRPR